jgi:hypothetical protein
LFCYILIVEEPKQEGSKNTSPENFGFATVGSVVTITVVAVIFR